MKTVIFFRHGKSDWGADYGHDHDRPLAARGRRASEAMGRWLTGQGPLPARILCSTATRARQTCSRAVRAGGWKAPVLYDRRLYGANPQGVLSRVQEQPDAAGCILLVGHQPTWSMTASLLAGVEVGRFPTATMACVTLEIRSWADASFGTGSLLWLQHPREL